MPATILFINGITDIAAEIKLLRMAHPEIAKTYFSPVKKADFEIISRGKSFIRVCFGGFFQFQKDFITCQIGCIEEHFVAPLNKTLQ